MPTYQYACTECDNRFEQVQAFTDASLTECPQCHGRLRKVYGSVGVVFKGSGFYRTDSRTGAGSTASTPASSDHGSSKSGDGADSSSDAKAGSGSSNGASSNGSSGSSSSGSSSSGAGSSSSSTSSSSAPAKAAAG